MSFAGEADNWVRLGGPITVQPQRPSCSRNTLRNLTLQSRLWFPNAGNFFTTNSVLFGSESGLQVHMHSLTAVVAIHLSNTDSPMAILTSSGLSRNFILTAIIQNKILKHL